VKNTAYTTAGLNCQSGRRSSSISGEPAVLTLSPSPRSRGPYYSVADTSATAAPAARSRHLHVRMLPVELTSTRTDADHLVYAPMLDLISAAVIEFVLGLLPETRRGRIIMWTFIAATLALAAAALAVVLF
jgi:hypothetical protein